MDAVGPSPVRDPKAARRAVQFIAAVALMNSVAGMITVPVLPTLVKEFTGDTGHAVAYVGLFAAMFALVQFLVSPIIGALSDRYGRRAVILPAVFCAAADFVLMALAPTLGWLMAARLISGLTAGSNPAINAYVADVITPEERAAHYGWIGAAGSAGFLFGPALGGILGEISPRLPFWVSAGLCFVNGLYGLFVLPESLPRDRRAPFSWRRANPLGSFQFMKERPQILGLLAIFVVMFFAQQCQQHTVVLYTNYRYGWTPAQVGTYLTVVGVGSLLVQAFLVRRFVRRFGERAAAITGFSICSIAFVLYGAAPTDGVFILGMPFFCMFGLVNPSLQAQVTRRVAPTEQGRLQGVNAGLMALTGLIGPIVYTQVFALSIGPFASFMPAGAAYYLAAVCLLTGAMLAARNMSRP